MATLPLLLVIHLCLIGSAAQAFLHPNHRSTAPRRNHFLSIPPRTPRQIQSSSKSALQATSSSLIDIAPDAEYITTCKDIAVTIPERTSSDSDASSSPSNNKQWPIEAANILSKYGVCALTRPSPSSSPSPSMTQPHHATNSSSSLISDPSLCDMVNTAINDYLSNLHRKIERRGIDPSGVDDGPYRFREVVCRDGSPRFDVPIPVSRSIENDSGDDEGEKELVLADFIDDSHACEVIETFHKEMDGIIQPVINALWEEDRDGNNNNNDTNDNSNSNNNNTTGDHNENGGRATSAGFLVNKPGSTSQQWHRDGPTNGYINAFVPLVDLEESLGPTTILPRTHAMPDHYVRTNDSKDGSDVVTLDDHTGDDTGNDDGDGVVQLLPITPMLKKGQILLFDYRTLHRGLGNTNIEGGGGGGNSRTLAYVVYTRGSITDVHNFPDALTLEYD